MYIFIKIRLNIPIQCQGNYMEMKKFNYMLEIEILRNSSQKNLGVLRRAFQGCTKRHPGALLAKTMSLVHCVDWHHSESLNLQAGGLMDTDTRLSTGILRKENLVVPSFCHCWYYTTQLGQLSRNGIFSGTRSLVWFPPWLAISLWSIAASIAAVLSH